MIREVDINEISDGRRYRSSDMVKIGCADCAGCSECCRQVDDTIILDPYDINELCRGLDTTFDDLLSGAYLLKNKSLSDIPGPTQSGETEMTLIPAIELGHADGLLLPHLNISKETGGCVFLSRDGRCTIHDFRPGFCRLYPLGRIYENGSFSYFIQIHECPYPNKTKVKIKKWLGIRDLSSYEAFVLKWHDILENARKELSDIHDISERSRYIVSFLGKYYQNESGETSPDPSGLL